MQSHTLSELRLSILSSVDFVLDPAKVASAKRQLAALPRPSVIAPPRPPPLQSLITSAMLKELYTDPRFSHLTFNKGATVMKAMKEKRNDCTPEQLDVRSLESMRKSCIQSRHDIRNIGTSEESTPRIRTTICCFFGES